MGEETDGGGKTKRKSRRKQALKNVKVFSMQASILKSTKNEGKNYDRP